jgi:hypothetical protein
MIKVMWFLKRAEHLTLAEFRSWWLEEHVMDIAADQKPYLKRYVVDVRIDDDTPLAGRQTGRDPRRRPHRHGHGASRRRSALRPAPSPRCLCPAGARRPRRRSVTVFATHERGSEMKPLRTFRLEEYLGEWELSVRHHLTASDAQSMKLGELLAMGTPDYETLGAEHVLTFTGAEEALFWAMQEIVGPGDHAIVLVPCYQSMETVTLATGAEVTPLVVRRGTGWALDVEEVRALLRPNTKLVAVNYPHNPTGYVPEATTFRALAELCDERGIRLFCDEVYRGIEVDPSRTLAQAADLSEKAVSLNVASKSDCLPGLRQSACGRRLTQAAPPAIPRVPSRSCCACPRCELPWPPRRERHPARARRPE